MKLTTKARNALPAAKFASPKKRKFPLEDKAHIRSARSYERFASPAEKAKIDAAAAKAGIGKSNKNSRGK